MIDNNWVPFTEVIRFAIENIATIESVDQIRQAFRNRVTDITKKRHDILRENAPDVFIGTTRRFVGQENYWFGFKEPSDFHGEFSVDFLPRNSREVLRASPSALRLVNWRVQAFAEGTFARREAYKRYLAVVRLLLPILGEPLTDEADIEWVNQLKQVDNEIDCWEHSMLDTQYAVTARALLDSSSVSFSMSELF